MQPGSADVLGKHLQARTTTTKTGVDVLIEQLLGCNHSLHGVSEMAFTKGQVLIEEWRIQAGRHRRLPRYQHRPIKAKIVRIGAMYRAMQKTMMAAHIKYFGCRTFCAPILTLSR